MAHLTNLNIHIVFVEDGQKIKRISPSQIRFTQNTIAYKFGDSRTLDDTLDNLKSGKITVESIPKITVIFTEEYEAYFTHDNRRLCVFQKYEAYLGKELLIPCIIGEPEGLSRKQITTNRRSLGKSVQIVKENYKSNKKTENKHLEEWTPQKIRKA